MPDKFKRPESVLLIIATRSGDFLLLRRTQPAGFWQSVTGSLEPGETPRQAAWRELREETGLSVPTAALLDLRHRERFPMPGETAMPPTFTRTSNTGSPSFYPFGV